MDFLRSTGVPLAPPVLWRFNDSVSRTVEPGIQGLLLQLPIYDPEGRQDRYRQKAAGDPCDLSAREDSEDDDQGMDLCACTQQVGRQDIVLENAEYG